MEDIEAKVKIDIDVSMVEPSMWAGQENARFAIAMDAPDGSIVWYQSADWALYGRMHGWTRVARIRKP